jgi:hypothetical protein
MPETLSAVIAAYEAESHPGRRAALIHWLWDDRDRSVIPTMQTALLEADECVWKETLDGLVALGGEAATLALREVRETPVGQPHGDVKRASVDESIEQIDEISREQP